MPFGLIAPLQTGLRSSVPSLVMQSGLFNKLLLGLLLVLSVATWAILVDRWRKIGAMTAADRRFRAAFRSTTGLNEVRLLATQHPQSLQGRLAQEGLAHLWPRGEQPDLTPETIDMASRAMERLRSDELDLVEKNVGFLATVGSVSPFIGLMGTVWGVMSAFLNIGVQGSASLVVVAPGIAEALIATVAGLAAAIPAVVGYNQLAGKLRVLANDAATFVSEFADAASREARQRQRAGAAGAPGATAVYEGARR
ncbi:MAG: MotA/TolQ/ExbB proton channel family protein [Candidatus Eisenbacteria bacterium]